jgi:glycosyltransferase involved in cell wall biosynthesis
VASISRFDRDRLKAEAGPSAEEKIRVIHCGVDGRGTPVRREQENPPMLLCVGSLIEKKGHDVLLRACALLKERGIRFECRIAGDGPLKEALMAEARSLGVEDSTVFAGACDQETVRSLYEQARVFALPSVYASNGDLDGIPVVLMEAMAAGVPCVSTRVSGIPELIESPKEGILVEEKDPAALADAIDLLLKDGALRERIVRAARAKVEREFNLNKSADQLAELFRGYASPGVAR